jgi:hypothetical protein
VAWRLLDLGARDGRFILTTLLVVMSWRWWGLILFRFWWAVILIRVRKLVSGSVSTGWVDVFSDGYWGVSIDVPEGVDGGDDCCYLCLVKVILSLCLLLYVLTISYTCYLGIIH